MHAHRSESPDWYEKDHHPKQRQTIVARLIPYSDDGTVIHIKKYNLFGLLGGHVTQNEMKSMIGKNWLDVSTMRPTLIGEGLEESGRNFSRFLQTPNATFIGISDITIDDRIKNIVTAVRSFIFSCRIPKTMPFNPPVFRSHIDEIKPMYPDAEMALSFLWWKGFRGRGVVPWRLHLNFPNESVTAVKTNRGYTFFHRHLP
jgi:hypothetical protein